jgi:hypothetical protein
MPQATIQKRDYTLLGRILYQKRPDIAQELLDAYYPHTAPSENDLSKIRYFFHRFCTLQHIDPQDYTGAIRLIHKNYKRKVFIAAVLHLYCPDIFSEYKPRQSRAGLSKTLSDVLGIAESNMSNLIKQVVRWQDYDDFKEEVEGAVKLLNGFDTPMTQAVNDLLEGRDGKRAVA